MTTSTQPQPGSPAHLMREVQGGCGFRLHLRATIVCQSPVRRGRACADSDEFEAPAEPYSLDEFGDLAMAEFERRGWKYGMDGARCPECVRRRR